MKFLVIGASGFIGSHLMNELRRSGHEVIGTSSHEGVDGLLKFDLLVDTLTKAIPRRFLELGDPPVIVLAAVQGNMDRCLADPHTSRLINVAKPIALIRHAMSYGAPVLFLSTGHVFDGTLGNRIESDPIKPVNEYARQKLEVEQFLQDEYPNALIARMDKVVGETSRHHHLLTEWWELARDHMPIVCVEGMEISPTSVNDISKGLKLAAERGLRGIFHLAGPDRMTRAELANRFCAIGNVKSPVVEKPLSAFGFLDGRALRSSLNGNKFQDAIGMRFSTANDILQRFFKNSGALPSPTDY